ncbi:MAG: hypothetical protein QXF46_01925 [Thermofilaceae archaeon]
MEWKRDVLSAMGLSLVSLSAKDWVLLILHVGGQSPIKGEEILHTIFFMMQYPPFNFRPLILSVYSNELHHAIEELTEMGLVKREYAFEKGRAVEVLALTEKGAFEASKLAEKVGESWISIGGVMVREGSKVLSELEAMKKTYNGRDITELLKLFLDRIDDPESTFDLWFTRDEIEYLKKVYRSFKRIM